MKSYGMRGVLILFAAASVIARANPEVYTCARLPEPSGWAEYLSKGLRLHDPQATRMIPVVGDIVHGRVQDLKERLDAGLDTSATLQLMPIDEGMSLLTLAIAACQKGIVDLLIERGANVNGKDSDTPLVVAAGKAEDDIVALLLSRGAQIDKTDFMGHTALEDAVRQRHARTVQKLLEYGSDVNRDIGGGGTVLAFVDKSFDPNEVRIAQLLRAHGAAAQYVDLNCDARCEDSQE